MTLVRMTVHDIRAALWPLKKATAETELRRAASALFHAANVVQDWIHYTGSSEFASDGPTVALLDDLYSDVMMAGARACNAVGEWHDLLHDETGKLRTPIVETLDDALAVYYDERGESAPIPSSHSEYDHERGGWVLENVNGELALVREDGTID